MVRDKLGVRAQRAPLSEFGGHAQHFVERTIAGLSGAHAGLAQHPHALIDGDPPDRLYVEGIADQRQQGL